MKRLVIVLLLAALVAPVFADDALLIPGRVIRFRTIPSFSFITQTFDKDGERQDITQNADLSSLGLGDATFGIDSIQVWTLSFALEVGLTDQITVAAQWTPGWSFASAINASSNEAPELTTAVGLSAITQAQADGIQAQTIERIENAQATGLDDLFLGAKILILGPNGFVPNDRMRFATSVGGVIPLSIYDVDEADADQTANNEYQQGRVGPDAFAAGIRLHYDYIVTPIFFVNLYSQTLVYFPRDLDEGGGVESEYSYGYDQTFELDPQVRIPVGEGITMSGSLAAAFNFTPDIEIDGVKQTDTATQLLTLNPEVGALFTVLPVPLEAKLQYTLPLYGVSTQATNTIALQLNTYLRY